MPSNYISQKLVDLIEKHADSLTRAWMRDVRKNEETPTYHTFDEQLLYDAAFEVFSQLGKWISRTTTKEDVARYFKPLGRRRREQGFKLEEIIKALTLTRRHVWLTVLSSGLMDTALELLQAMELNNRVVLFFDRAIYYTTIGYMEKK